MADSSTPYRTHHGRTAGMQANSYPVRHGRRHVRACRGARASSLSSKLLFGAALIVLASSPLRAQLLHWNRTAGLAVSAAPGLQRTALTAPDGAGGCLTVWESIEASGTRLIAQRISTDGRLLWGADGVVIADGTSAKSLGAVEAMPDGGVAVVWSERRAADGDIFAQRLMMDGRVLWTPGGVAVHAAPREQVNPVARRIGTDALAVVWEDRSGSHIDLRYAVLAADGRTIGTGSPAPLVAAAGDQIAPVLTRDTDGGVVAAWQDGRAGWDIYAQRIAADGTLRWQADGQPVIRHTASQRNPRITAPSSGTLFVAWEDDRGDVSDIYYQRLDLFGAPLHAGEGLPLTRARDAQGDIALAADGEGGVIVAWTDFRAGTTNPDIYARRVLSDGQAGWKTTGADSLNGLAICTAAEPQELPRVVGDGRGGALIVWQDRRAVSHADLWMQWMHGSVTRMYPANGLPVVLAERNQIGVRAVAGNDGSVLATWTDGRVADGAADIYAQRISLPVFREDSIWFDTLKYSHERRITVTLAHATDDTLLVTAIASIGTHAADFVVVDQPGLPLRLLPGDTLRVDVAFRPRAAGYRTGWLRVTHGGGSLHLTRVGALCITPAFTIFPSRIDFGTRKVGLAVDTLLGGCLKNLGTGPLTIYDIVIDGSTPHAFSLVNPPPLPILVPAGDSIAITVRFRSVFNGGQSAYITFLADGSTSVRSIYVNGNGVYPTAVLTATAVTFDSSGGAPVSRRVWLRAGGTVPLGISAADIRGLNPFDFSTPLAVPRTIAPGDSIPIDLVFHPVNNGVRSAWLRLETDLVSPVLTIALSGTGTGIITSTGPSPVPPRSLELGSPWPHPVRSRDRSVMLPVSGAAPLSVLRADVFDAVGRIVRTGMGTADAGGACTIVLSAGLDTGMYAVRIRAADGSLPGSEGPRAIIRTLIVIR